MSNPVVSKRNPAYLWKTGSRSSVAREARPAYDLHVPAHRKLLRVYVDTSVVGGCLDEEFHSPSNRLIERSRIGNALLVIAADPQDVGRDLSLFTTLCSPPLSLTPKPSPSSSLFPRSPEGKGASL